MTGFNKVMRFCNTLLDYESAKNQGTITDDLFVVILQDKLAKFKGQTFDWSQNADLTALATKGELEDLAEEIASNERVWAEALNDLNERINDIGTGGGGGGGTSDIVVDAALSTTSTNAIQNKAVANALNEKADASALASKQDTLVSGTNIKTVNGQSIVGTGNIEIKAGTDIEVVNNLTDGGTDKALSAEQGKVLNEKITNLSSNAVLADDEHIVLRNAYQGTTTSLKKGMIIESIGDATGIILFRKGDNYEERIYPSNLPYVLTFDTIQVMPLSNAAGSEVIVKNFVDSKITTMSSESNGEIQRISEILDITTEGVAISLKDKYYKNIVLSTPLRKGMIIESISDAVGVYLKNQQGGETYIIASNLPYTLQEDIYIIIPVSNATGDMIVKNYLDSRLETLQTDFENEISSAVTEVAGNFTDTEIPLGGAFKAISVSLKTDAIITSIGNTSQLILIKQSDSTEYRISPSYLPYRLPFDVSEVIPTSDASGSSMVVMNDFEAKLTVLSEDVQHISGIQDITTEGVTISLKDKYYKSIVLSTPLREGMIIESISDATGVYLRNKDGVETLFRQDNFPHTLTEDVYAIIPISEATGDMVVKSYLNSKLEALENKGGGGIADLSEEPHIAIPMPTSLVTVKISASEFPTTKGGNISGFIAFYDRNGNFFRKPIESLALQGSTSLAAPKKNLKFDFSDCTVKIGNWVAQDSFHLKSNYFDAFRGKSNLAYDLWRKIIEYKRTNAFRTPYINASEYSWYKGVEALDYDFSEARLTPAGFPIELYFNDEYLGVYTWNIKKDRANYAMDKKKADNIHIDPSNIASLLTGESVIWENFEIRNPKSLVTMDGGKYDGDYPSELIDSSSAAYDGSNEDHIMSASVKANIIALKNACAEIQSKKDKATFEKYFDKDWFIDFHIWGNVVLDGDSLSRNTQYLYWGDKWYPTPYDCDQIYGNSWRGNWIYRKGQRVVNASILGQGNGIYDTFITLYATDIAQRYKDLRDADVISVNGIISQLSHYVDIIGKDEFKKEFEKWNETPSYRKPNDNPQWHYEGDYYEGEIIEWNNTTTYSVGQYVYIVIEGDRYYWRCLESNTGVRPYYDKYVSVPIVGGIFDSLTRTEKWLTARFSFLDNHYNL